MSTTHPRVLWLDDKIERYYIVVAHLVFRGFTVFCAASPETAAQLAAEIDPEIILLDFVLSDQPLARTGLDILREIAAKHPNASIAFVTAYPERLHASLQSDLGKIPILDKRTLTEIRPSSDVSSFDTFLRSLRSNPDASPPIQASVRQTAKQIRRETSSIIRWPWSTIQKATESVTIKIASSVPLPVAALIALTQLQLSIPLLVVFGGYIVLGVAYVLYRFTIPTEIKKFSDQFEYYKTFADVLQKNPPVRAKMIQEVGESRSSLLESSDFYLLTTHFNILSGRRPLTRCFVTLLFMAGLTITIIPSILLFWSKLVVLLPKRPPLSH